jgi:hypothetical protein
MKTTKTTKTILRVALALGLAGGVSYARDWNGKLLDAGCFDQNSSAATSGKSRIDLGKTCMPTASTTAFAFQSADSGKVYKLDENSNAKAEKALSDGILNASKKDGEYHVKVSGSHKKGVMGVNGIAPRKGNPAVF